MLYPQLDLDITWIEYPVLCLSSLPYGSARAPRESALLILLSYNMVELLDCRIYLIRAKQTIVPVIGSKTGILAVICFGVSNDFR